MHVVACVVMWLLFIFLQIELRTKMVEAKYHEDKLKLQQQHDVAVQKVPVLEYDNVLLHLPFQTQMRAVKSQVSTISWGK